MNIGHTCAKAVGNQAVDQLHQWRVLVITRLHHAALAGNLYFANVHLRLGQLGH